MADRIHTGVNKGGGVPPFRWTVQYLRIARDEAMKILDSHHAYMHIADQFKELAYEDDPSRSDIIDTRRIQNEEFLEIRDKGGPLEKLHSERSILSTKKIAGSLCWDLFRSRTMGLLRKDTLFACAVA